MRADFFFRERSNTEDPAWSMNGDPWGVTIVLNEELLADVMRRPPDDHDDLEISIALAQLVHDELEEYGTAGGQRVDDREMALALRALHAVLKRLGVDDTVPFRNLTSFRSYWIRHECAGSWQARRDLLAEIFEPIHAKLLRLEDTTLEALADPISPLAGTGWPVVDEEIRELRRRFQISTTAQDYRAVGTHCIGVLEALGRTVYDPSKHLHEGETIPPPDHTKQRIGRYVEHSLGGKEHEYVRAAVSKVIELAHHVKHATTPTRREAGIASDSVILLANILRRLDQPM